MIAYYGDISGVPGYIHMPEDAQKNSEWVQLPIPDVTLISIDTKSILEPQAFTPEIK